MVQLALKSSNWIRLSTWEADKAEWTPILEALKYYYKSATESFGNEAKVMLLCGGDFVETFNKPNLWKDVHVILML
jgi:nicotinamide mononucleotide adenylyltransferase